MFTRPSSSVCGLGRGLPLRARKVRESPVTMVFTMDDSIATRTSEASPIDGHVDQDIAWAMQVAVLYDKHHPASHVDTCEAAARAVVELIASEQARSGEWQQAVDFWRDGRIRKLVRRAKGQVRWDEVQDVPGVSVEQAVEGRHPAAARAFVPGPVRPLDVRLNKLQVSGTELPDELPSASTDAIVLVGISPLVTMTTGKAAAQCGHAAQLAWQAMDEPSRQRWAADGHRVRVAVIDEQRWSIDPGRIQVVDAGFTELDGPTETTRAWW